MLAVVNFVPGTLITSTRRGSLAAGESCAPERTTKKMPIGVTLRLPSGALRCQVRKLQENLSLWFSEPSERGEPMNVGECRKKAVMALVRARVAGDPESRRDWLDQAKGWSALAREWLSWEAEGMDRHEVHRFARRSVASRH